MPSFFYLVSGWYIIPIDPKWWFSFVTIMDFFSWRFKIIFVLLQDRQQQVKHLMPIKTYIAECLDKIQGVIRGILCIVLYSGFMKVINVFYSLLYSLFYVVLCYVICCDAQYPIDSVSLCMSRIVQRLICWSG